MAEIEGDFDIGDGQKEKQTDITVPWAGHFVAAKDNKRRVMSLVATWSTMPVITITGNLVKSYMNVRTAANPEAVCNLVSIWLPDFWLSANQQAMVSSVDADTEFNPLTFYSIQRCFIEI